MPLTPLRIAVMLLVFWPWLASARADASAKDDFYRAYYLQHEEQDPEAALALYEDVARSRGLPAELKAQAEDGAARCREDIKSADLAQLFPPETFVYVEVNHPGGHLERLIEQLGLIGTPEDVTAGGKGEPISTVRISPTLLSAFSHFRGLAVGVTGFNMFRQEPQWVAVLDPGTDELIRGAVETAVATLGKPGKKVAGVRTFLLDLEDVKLHVALGKRLVFVSQQQAMVKQALKRLRDDSLADLSKTDVLGPVLSKREHAMVFVAADFQKIQGLIKNLMMAGKTADPGFAIAQALVDFESFRTAYFQAGVTPDGLLAEAGLELEEGHHSFVINMLRTPSLSRDTLQYVPHGSAVVVMGALGESNGQAGGADKADTIRQFTGLDIGREFFANIQEVSIFLVPPEAGADATEGAAAAPSAGGKKIPIPDIGLVMTVRDPSRSEAIWSQLLGLPSLALGMPEASQETLEIAGQEVCIYEWPEGIRIYFAATDDAILVAPSEGLIRRALHARKSPSDSLLRDEGFAPILASLADDTSKACMVHVGRTLQFAKQFMPARERKEVARFEGSLREMAVCVQTRETPNSLHFSARVSGLPDVGQLITNMGGLDTVMGHEAKSKRKLASASTPPAARAGSPHAGEQDDKTKPAKKDKKPRKSKREKQARQGSNLEDGGPGASPAILTPEATPAKKQE